ncbi:MAG: stage IV sporulation protein A, partial [Bacilli bacterium]
MDKKEIIKGVSIKGDGEILLGVVGAVRTGKSTFIKKFLETLVIPNIEDETDKKRCLDETPQTAQGKTIMTIEPKFVPSSGASIKVEEFSTNIKLVDCVGYVIPESKGYEDENGNPRMVKTPWYDEELPFVEAASIGTEKVIKDHATIGIVITTDGSFGDFSRSNYESVEEKIVGELKEINKPFIVILNSSHPQSSDTINLANELNNRYSVPVIPMSVLNMNETLALNVLKEALYEFPVEEIEFKIPDWIGVLNADHPIKKTYMECMKSSIKDVFKLKDIEGINIELLETKEISRAYVSDLNTYSGNVTITLEAPNELFDEVLKEVVGVSIDTKASLLKVFQDFSSGKNEYDNFKEAIKQVNLTGYGIAYPKVSDMHLEKPEIIKQSGRYGVKLKAVASSIH